MFEPKQLVLAKIKGFPDWPAIIVPIESIPAKLSSSRYQRQIDAYLKNDVCVKFYFDDQYSWTKLTNLKPLSLDMVEAFLLQDHGGRRKKRIVEAFEKVKEVPVDEFLKWGSWGEPKPVVEDAEDVFEDGLDNKGGRKRKNNNGSKQTGKGKGKGKGKDKDKDQDKDLGRENKRRRSGRATKVTEETSTPEFTEEEQIVDDEDVEYQLVLAKIKGFPEWPAIIVPIESIPAKLSSSRYQRQIDAYLKNDVCVKFYFDDQYSWTKLTNLKPLSLDMVEAFVLQDHGGRRKKRIVEAFEKVKEVPVDEFLKWGSWGEPKPVVEDAEDVFEDGLDNKGGRKRKNNNGSKQTGKGKGKGKGKDKDKDQDKDLGRETKRRRSGRATKVTEETSTPEFTEEEQIVDDEDVEY
ncbi:hypothetical protein JL09_g3012, partial [Pichia kudriavzevii]